tara:strand:+ start:1128 stop:2114 length:987 start_codon:yes stop_codon:yes gene_type:complete
MNEITKSEETKSFYIDRAKQLMIRAYKELLEKRKEVDESETKIINHKGSDKVALSIKYTAVWASKFWTKIWLQSSYKLNRNALIYYAELELNNNNIKEEEFEKIKELLKKSRATETKNSGKTSNSKKKSINQKEFKSLDSELKKSRSRWANPTRVFIRAGKYSGLRPIEWKDAIIDTDNKILKIKNAKNTNGRSNGKMRTLSLHHLEDDQIKDIELQIKIVQAILEKNIWNLYYEGCSALLRRLSRKLWPNKKKYPTLYSCRHQFAADMKASGCTRKEVAALMGHASERTAESHYGKKIHGSRGRKPKVSKVDLKNVKIKSKNKFSFE